MYDDEKKKAAKRLTNESIFTGLTEARIEELLAMVPVVTKTYAKGEFLLMQGNTYAHLIVMLWGSAHAEMTDASGKTVTVETLTAPRAVAMGVLFASKNEVPVTLCANEKVQALILAKRDLFRLFHEEERLIENALRAVSDKFLFISQRFSYMSFQTIKGKVAHYLLTLPREGKTTVVIPKTIEELARYFGVLRPSLSRVLARLADDGIITLDGKRVSIRNEKALSRLAK